MSIKTIASTSHRVSIFSCIVGDKEVFIFLNYEVPLRENIYCHFEFEHDIEKNGGCSWSNSHQKKLFKN